MADISNSDDQQKHQQHAQVQSQSSSALQQQQQQPQPQQPQQQPQQQSTTTTTDSNGHQALTLRLLMQGKEVGSIIGKKGDNIKRFREKSGAKINVSDSSCPDRVVTLVGTLNEVYSAFSMICLKFEEQLLQPNFVGSSSSSTNTSSINNTSNSNNATSTQSTAATTTLNDTNNNTNSNSILNNVVPSVIDPLFGLPMPTSENRIRSGLMLNSMNNNSNSNNMDESTNVKKETDMLTINNNSTSTINNNNINAPNKNINTNANSDTNVAQHPAVTLRIIVPASQCGSLIGRGGAKIKEIREMTGASIQVAPDVLPNSTERVVTISGTVESLKSCAYQICTIMVGSPPKGYNIQYRPKPMLNPMLIAAAATAGQPAAAYNLPGQFLAAHPDVNRLFVPTNSSSLVAAFNQAAAAANLRAAASQTISSQEMAIPNGLIGCVIGKGGSKINEIRQLTGATIKISNPEEGAKNRTITINGTPEAISFAQYLINASCNGCQTSPLDNITKPWIANKSLQHLIGQSYSTPK